MRTTRLISLLALSVALGGLPAAAMADEQADGQRLLDQVGAGKLTCSDVKPAQFELMGEAVMGQAFANPAAHEQMNRLMSSMMGARGESQMHEILGRRAAGCSGGGAVEGLGPMMGSMGAMMGMMGGAYGSSGSSGPGSSGPGNMMGGAGMMGQGTGSWRDDAGGRGATDGSTDRWDGADTMMVVMMGLLLVTIVIAMALFLPGRRRSAGPDRPLDVLTRRFAEGQIDREEFEQRRAALGGTS